MQGFLPMGAAGFEPATSRHRSRSLHVLPLRSDEDGAKEGRLVDPTRLDQIPLFADLTAEERAEVAACLHEVSVDAGSSLATQGENAYQLFVIESGHAEVRKDGELIGTLSAGDV